LFNSANLIVDNSAHDFGTRLERWLKQSRKFEFGILFAVKPDVTITNVEKLTACADRD